MGNVFMRKTDDVFQVALNIRKKLILKKNVDFLIVDFHGEITSEKMAMGNFFDVKATAVV
jgi:calcineurin-like phosphoesterase